MQMSLRLVLAAMLALAVAAGPAAQSNAPPEAFTATAILNNNLGSGAGTVIITITRWSSLAEREAFVTTLQQQGADALLERLRDSRSVGTIRTPDTLAYDLRYAHQVPGPDGGRRIVIATDRPIGFWEARNQPRTLDYPFTVVQMQIDRDGEGTGTLSYAAKITPLRDSIELENFGTSPIMLTRIEASPVD